jgi:hypothetical protein
VGRRVNVNINAFSLGLYNVTEEQQVYSATWDMPYATRCVHEYRVAVTHPGLARVGPSRQQRLYNLGVALLARNQQGCGRIVLCTQAHTSAQRGIARQPRTHRANKCRSAKAPPPTYSGLVHHCPMVQQCRHHSSVSLLSGDVQGRSTVVLNRRGNDVGPNHDGGGHTGALHCDLNHPAPR